MNEACKTFAYRELAVGDHASFSTVVTEALVNDFGRISGDMNPLHMDAEYASKTAFGCRIAHGMIVGALFSKFVGMHLPGKYALYLSQILRFHEPVAINTEVTVYGEITHKSDALKVVSIDMKAWDENTKLIFVTGEAKVRLLQ